MTCDEFPFTRSKTMEDANFKRIESNLSKCISERNPTNLVNSTREISIMFNEKFSKLNRINTFIQSMNDNLKGTEFYDKALGKLQSHSVSDQIKSLLNVVSDVVRSFKDKSVVESTDLQSRVMNMFLTLKDEYTCQRNMKFELVGITKRKLFDSLKESPKVYYQRARDNFVVECMASDQKQLSMQMTRLVDITSFTLAVTDEFTLQASPLNELLAMCEDYFFGANDQPSSIKVAQELKDLLLECEYLVAFGELKANFNDLVNEIGEFMKKISIETNADKIFELCKDCCTISLKRAVVFEQKVLMFQVSGSAKLDVDKMEYSKEYLTFLIESKKSLGRILKQNSVEMQQNSLMWLIDISQKSKTILSLMCLPYQEEKRQAQIAETASVSVTPVASISEEPSIKSKKTHHIHAKKKSYFPKSSSVFSSQSVTSSDEDLHPTIKELAQTIENDEEGLVYHTPGKRRSLQRGGLPTIKLNKDMFLGGKNAKCLKGATLVKLIERITWFRNSDPELAQAVILTHHMFCTSEQLFNLLINRYLYSTQQFESLPTPTAANDFVSSQIITPTKLKVLWVFEMWIKLAVNDLSEHLEQLQLFLKVNVYRDFPSGAIQLQNLINEELNPRIVDTIPIAPILPKRMGESLISSVNPVEIARQLALIDHALLKKLNLNSLVLSKGSHDAEVQALIQRFNFFTHWITSLILSFQSAKDRANAIKNCICIAEQCAELGNMNSLKAIIGSLKCASVHRLHQSWELVPRKYTTILRELERVTSSENNYNDMRNFMNMVDYPCIPWMGLYLRDLVFINDAHQTYVSTEESKPIINVQKVHAIGPILIHVKNCQTHSYPYLAVPFIQNAMTNPGGVITDENEHFQMSIRLEPKEVDTEKEN